MYDIMEATALLLYAAELVPALRWRSTGRTLAILLAVMTAPELGDRRANYEYRTSIKVPGLLSCRVINQFII